MVHSNIEEIQVFDEEIEMMDLGVENTHCLYCNGVLVHNCAQEMRLAANFSKEPNFVDPILGGNDIHMYVAKKMFGFEDPDHRTKVKIVNFCLGEDSYVTTDRGLIRPYNLRPDDMLLKVFGGTQSFRMEVRLSDTVKIHYSNGVVEEYDSRHQVAVTSDKGLTWKRVCDLTADDEVLISTGRMKEQSAPLVERVGTFRKFTVSRDREFDISTKEFAYLAGLYLGDGYISLGKQGRPNSVSWVVEEQIYSLVEQCLFSLDLTWRVRQYKDKNYRVYQVHSSQFARVLEKFFGRTKGKTISDEVLDAWGKDLFIPLCQGLVDSDGTRDKNTLIYCTCSDLLASKVALVLSGIGVYVRETLGAHNCHKFRFAENGIIQSNLDRKKCSCDNVQISFKKFDKSILEGLPWDFENGRVDNILRGKCGLWVKSSLVDRAGYSGLRPVAVVSRTEPKAGKIYVIETETGSYLSSSIVSHNSALYGAEGPTIAQRAGISLEEGKALFAKYKATMSKLYAWRAEVIKQCRRRGYSLTYFGRPVYLLKYYNSSNKRDIAYADRLSVNSTIQGCIPDATYVPSQDGKTVSSIRKFVGDRIKFLKDERGLSRVGVPTFRGVDNCYFVEFRSGDFMVVSRFHKFLKYGSEYLVGLGEVSGSDIQFVKPNKKVKFWKALFSAPFVKSDSLAVLAVSLKDTMPCDSLSVAVTLLKGWLFKERISLSDFVANSVRSFVDLYGYNLVRTKSGTYRLKWSRPKKSKGRRVWLVGSYPVVSPSMISGYQTYPLSGIIHKNTGADLMRLFLIKFTMLNKNNQEWRDNTRMILPVHDEQNLEVHKSYLYKAWKLMKKVMEFHPDNFLVPMTVDTGIGTSWGNCLDASCISLDNRIVPAGVDPEMLEGDELDYYVDIVKHCKEDDLPEKLKKYFNA